MRADQLLLQLKLASSRSQAQRLIGAGVRWRNAAGGDAPWKHIGKNSDDVPDDAQIDLLDASEARYVSRGGLKLEGALTSSGVDPRGKTCLDVGQSTGGFTDCLLQHGAALVVGVDVGQGQLHPALREHPQVLALEHINARELSVENLVATDIVANYISSTWEKDLFDDQIEIDSPAVAGGGPVSAATACGLASEFNGTFDLIAGDLSFISQTLVLPALAALLKPGADLLMLVKPQFELQPGQVGKGGIVKDAAMYAIVEQRIRDTYTALGLQIHGWFDSPITGGDGNREFFVHATAPALPKAAKASAT
jgi:23S rRNA (cytidine1920-2'-O)/16S rRNA (cytidine1409-2'-O)-methyltransferase